GSPAARALCPRMARRFRCDFGSVGGHTVLAKWRRQPLVPCPSLSDCCEQRDDRVVFPYIPYCGDDIELLTRRRLRQSASAGGPMRALFLGLAAVMLSTMSAFAMSDDDLRAALEQRFKGDRTGACVAAAVIDNGTTASAYFCADPKSRRPYDEHTAFEIGSVTKTMNAALLAEFLARGEVTLDHPIAKLLPPGTSVPSFNGRQITIGNIVTYTSGLPSFPWRMTDMNNPYATLTERDLLGALATTRLTRAPGSQWQYSNFAMMVLSYALAKRSGKDYETLLRERLLAPLGMNDTYITKRPPQVRLAQGHFSNTMPAVSWDFHVDMAGVGGVRATLPDMVRYVEGELGTRESVITPALAQTQQQVVSVGGYTMGMNWIIRSAANGHTIVSHEGGTGSNA